MYDIHTPRFTLREHVLPHNIQVVSLPALVKIDAHACPPPPLRLLGGYISCGAEQGALDDLAPHVFVRYGDEIAEVAARTLREVREPGVALALPDKIEGGRSLCGRARVAWDEPDVSKTVPGGFTT